MPTGAKNRQHYLRNLEVMKIFSELSWMVEKIFSELPGGFTNDDIRETESEIHAFSKTQVEDYPFYLRSSNKHINTHTHANKHTHPYTSKLR